MEFRILGPLEVVADGQPVPIGGRRQRALLARLLLSANETVSTDALIDAVWGEAPPETAPKALQNSVSQLRRLLAESGPALVTGAGGYSLRVGEDDVDARRFEQLAAEGRAALGEEMLDLQKKLGREGEPRELVVDQTDTAARL